MKYVFMTLITLAALSACQATHPTLKGDSAISRVDNCVCYKSTDSQKLQPWELAWNDPEKLRMQISHCVCETHIDIQNVENPSRYLVPGTTVK
jgi:hypothetical protein